MTRSYVGIPTCYKIDFFYEKNSFLLSVNNCILLFHTNDPISQIKYDNEEDRNIADALAGTFGYGGSYSSDIGHYYNEPGRIMIQQELDDLSVEVGTPGSRYERKIFAVEEIKKDLIDYFHFDLLTSSVLDPMKFTHPIPPELKGELLDAIKISLQSAMSQGGMSLEQMAEEMMDYPWSCIEYVVCKA